MTRAQQGAHCLPRLFSAFPRGMPGVGLLLLRTAIGLVTAWQGARLVATADTAWLERGVGLTGLLVAAALSVGFLTPLVATLVAIGAVWSAARGTMPIMEAQDGLAHGLVLIDAVSLVLLGPGALSLDARLFGCREIQIPESSRAPID